MQRVLRVPTAALLFAAADHTGHVGAPTTRWGPLRIYARDSAKLCAHLSSHTASLGSARHLRAHNFHDGPHGGGT